MQDYQDHFEALFNNTYLRWFHLQGKDVAVEISKVEKDVEMTMPGGASAKKPVVHFKGKDKPLVLNKTNANSIASLLGPGVSQWPGKSVVLYPTETKMWDKALRKSVMKPCIRIKGVK